jgi:predicted permease
MNALFQDLKFGLRMLAKNPGFTAVAVLTLALGIGANTAIFSLINTLMLRMLPVRDPGQLVELLHRYPGDPRLNGFSWQSYEHYRDHNHVLSGLIGFRPSRFSLRGDGLERETVDGEYVVGDYFPVLGVKPAIGRLIDPEVDQIGAEGSAVAVVSWSFWKSRFNLNPSILGKRIIVDEVPLTVIGVTPREFFGLEIWSRPEVWVPVTMEPAIHHTSQASFGLGELKLIGRLKPGVSIEQARAEMSLLFQFTIEEITKERDIPLWRQAKMELVPAGAGLALLRDRYAKPLLILMALVGLLLLIACTSIASMLLARAAARKREMALRVCLGAGRFRLLRQVLTESLLLSAAGSLLGIFLPYFGADALVRIITSGRTMPGLPPQIEIQVHPDAHVLLFTAGIALLTGVLFGLAPALRAMATAPASSLQAAGRASETQFGRLFGKGLVAVQVALSVMLLSAATLFIAYMENLEHLNLGFHKDHLLLVSLEPAHSGYSSDDLSQRYEELLGRLEVLPGVRSATLCAGTPLSGGGASGFANVEGFEEKPEDRRYVSINWVAPNYFHTLGMPLLAGRDFSSQDQGGTRVAIINQAMARYYFPGRDAIGKHFTLDRDWRGFGPDEPYEIVGVVGDAHYYEIREEPPRTIYFDTFQGRWVGSHLVLRTRIAPTVVAPDVRRTVREIVKGVSVGHITTMADQVDASIVPERVLAMISGSLGVLGSLLAALGLYGLLAYTVARRTNEIGVRMALGASRGSMARMVLRDALGMVSAGLVIGIPIALWARKFAASMIEGIPPSIVLPIYLAVAGIIAVALVASYIPARRATKVDPMVALRYE